MTNNQLTLEQAIQHTDEKAAALSGPCAEQHKQLAEWLRELQERRKAEIATRNPVLDYADSYRDMAGRGVESIPVWSVITDLERNIAPLYIAQPAPVSKNEPVSMFGIGSVFKPRIVSDEDVDCDNCAHYQPNICHGEGCPAAMLQAGNSPVTPDGWIPVSERMPESDGNYWGWWSESKRQGPVWFIKSDLQAQFQSSEITHWMPLPAAPQQEVKS